METLGTRYSGGLWMNELGSIIAATVAGSLGEGSR